MDRAHVRGEARRRHAADGVRGAVHGRSDARRQRPARRPDGRREGSAVFLQVQQGGACRGHRLQGADRCAPEGCLRASAALQPQAVLAGRARSQQAADDVGQGPVGCTEDLAEDRQARLRPDGQGRQHGGLDPDHGRVLPRRPHGAGDGHEGEGHAEQPADGCRLEPPAPHALDRQLDGVELRLRLERHQPGVRCWERRYVHQWLGRLHEPRSGLEHRSVHLRAGAAATCEEQEGRRPRRRDTRGRQAQRRLEREGRGSQVDRLLLRAAADHEVTGDPQREDARRQQAAGRRPRAPGVQQEAVRPREHLDQALHQRPDQSDEAVHDRDLQPDRDPGARSGNAERLPLARRGGRSRAHEQECRCARDAAAGERQPRSTRSRAAGSSALCGRLVAGCLGPATSRDRQAEV